MQDKLRYLLLSVWNIFLLAFVSFALFPLWLRKLSNFTKCRPTRSLWAGTPILTLPVLAKAERTLGVKSSSLVYTTYFLSEEFDYNLSRWCTPVIARAIISYGVFVWANWKFDRFHFFCDRGLLPNVKRFEFNKSELKIYHILDKEVLFYTYGADVRTREKTETLGKYHCCQECQSPGTACICSKHQSIKNMAQILNYGKAVFTMGDMIEYVPNSRNDLFFWPIDLEAENGKKYAPYFPFKVDDGPVRVIHASNHRHFKGTKFLIEAVKRLKAKNCAIELVIVENVSNQEALKIYRTADIIFDQCLIGFHGYLSIEAMAMGKPVICYIRKPSLYLLHPDECPIINCTPDHIESILNRLVKNRPVLHELGKKGRQYVEKYYSVDAFAARLQNTYNQIGLNL